MVSGTDTYCRDALSLPGEYPVFCAVETRPRLVVAKEAGREGTAAVSDPIPLYRLPRDQMPSAEAAFGVGTLVWEGAARVQASPVLPVTEGAAVLDADVPRFALASRVRAALPTAGKEDFPPFRSP